MANERGPTVLIPATTALCSTTSTDTKAGTKKGVDLLAPFEIRGAAGSSICKKQRRGRNPHVTGKVLNS